MSNGRMPLLAANWKMNLTRREGRNLVEELVQAVSPLRGREMVIAPSFHLLTEVGAVLQGKPNVHLAAQNMYWKEAGAFTGEISPLMLRDCNCAYVIIGHSERRAFFHENDADCAKKVEAAQAHGLIPILCVGESLDQKEAGQTKAVVVEQLRGALGKIRVDSGDRLVIAYEPIWAIGTGKNDTPAQANETMSELRAELAQLFGERIAQQVRLLYGGSVKPGNIDAFMACTHIDGALVGGASLQAADFARIVQFQESAPSAQ
jgi:triosephosphate isomerase